MSRTPEGLDWTGEVLATQSFLLALFNDVEPEVEEPPVIPPPDDEGPPEGETDLPPDLPPGDDTPIDLPEGELDDYPDEEGGPGDEPVPEPDPETEGEPGGTEGTGTEGSGDDPEDVIAQPDLPRLPGEITAVGMRRAPGSASYNGGDGYFTVTKVFTAVESALVNRVGVLSEDGRLIYEQQVPDPGQTVDAGKSIAVTAQITL